MNEQRKSANNMMWVTYWMEHVAESDKDSFIIAKQQENGKWRCDIEIPLVDKVVTSTSSTQTNAMKNASDKAAKLINEYAKEHPEIKCINSFKGQEWIFYEDENGKYIGAGLSEKAEERSKRKAKEIMDGSLKAVQKAIERITRLNGSDKGLYIQVIDKSVLGENPSKEEITMKLWDMVQEKYNYEIMGLNWTEFGESIIAIGYVFPNCDA